MPRVKLDDIDLYYEVIGHGSEPIIICRTTPIREEMVSLFPPEYRVYLLDLPGFGKSTHLDEFRGFKQWAEDIYHFSHKIGLEKFIYAGVSMLGIIGFQLVLDHPEVIKVFIPIVCVPILEPPLPHPDEQKAIESGDNTARLAAAEKTLMFPAPTSDTFRLKRREKWRQQQINNIRPDDTSATARAKQGILSTNETRKNMVSRLGEITVPTLFLFGALDRSNPLEEAIGSAMKVPGAKAVFFQDYGHGLHIEGPEKIVEQIILFINELNPISDNIQ